MSSDGILNLSEDELALASAKKTKQNKLAFALFLKYFQLEGHYPKHLKYIDSRLLHCVANQLDVSASLVDNFDFEGRSTDRFRQEIRNLLGYREATLQDADQFKSWMIKNVFQNGVKKSQQIEYAYEYFREQRIEHFASRELERYMGVAMK